MVCNLDVFPAIAEYWIFLANGASRTIMNPSVSLVISTYNRPNALKVCLESVLSQRTMPDEVIIADDGSNEETRNLIDSFRPRFSVPLIHVWQPDEGYQLAAIRNKAFVKAAGEYIIQIDGDLILHPCFVTDHLSFRRRNCFVSGSRVMLNPGYTQRILDEGLPHSPGWLAKDISKRYNAIRCLPLGKLNYQLQRGQTNVKYVLGCNMAFWKEDLLKVNGYNEDFKGWGREDNDISVRLTNVGVDLRFVKFAALVYHLYHPERPRPDFDINDGIYGESLKNKLTYIPRGMIQSSE